MSPSFFGPTAFSPLVIPRSAATSTRKGRESRPRRDEESLSNQPIFCRNSFTPSGFREGPLATFFRVFSVLGAKLGPP